MGEAVLIMLELVSIYRKSGNNRGSSYHFEVAFAGKVHKSWVFFVLSQS